MFWKKIVPIICVILAVASLWFGYEQKKQKDEIIELNKKIAWAAFTQWITIYTEFEALERPDNGLKTTDYVLRNKNTYAAVNRNLIDNVLAYYPEKNYDELKKLLQEWIETGLVPQYAEDEFKSQIKAIR